MQIKESQKKCMQRESSLQPSGCKRDALLSELRRRKLMSHFSRKWQNIGP